ANLKGAILTRAVLIDADLSGANLDQAIFLNTQTEGCIGCP
nr:pentapeptide repeat-containing protein [Thauera sp.]